MLQRTQINLETGVYNPGGHGTAMKQAGIGLHPGLTGPSRRPFDAFDTLECDDSMA